jgi:hypothetical protein
LKLKTEDLVLVDAYQAGREVLSDDVVHQLGKIARDLGPPLTTCSQAVFHKTDVPIGSDPDVYGRTIEALLAEDGISWPVASYTMSAEIAKMHKLSNAASIENSFGIIFEVPAERIASAVIINLDALYRSGLIQQSLADRPETEFVHGIRNVGNREQEIIAGPIILTANDVYAIRPPSQSIEPYAKALEEVFVDPKVAEEKSIELFERLESHNMIGEHAAWIYGGQARNILRAALERVKQKAGDIGSLIRPEQIDDRDEGGLDAIPIA